MHGDTILLHTCTINQDHMMYGCCNIKYICAIFCPLTLLTTHKIKILKKIKTPWDIIILHLCTTNKDMMYGTWDIKHDRQFLSFWAIFCSFIPQKIKIKQPGKSKFWKNEKKKKKKKKLIFNCVLFWLANDLSKQH